MKHITEINKEIKQNKTDKGYYSPKIAQENADFRKVRFAKDRKFTPQIEKFVREKQAYETVRI